jgi:hypothetical protein
MNPSDPNSALATLRQLKEMLDAGALTPQEFEALKQKLIFGQEASATAAEPPVAEQPLGQVAPAPEPEVDLPVAPAKADLPPTSTTPEGTDWLSAAAPVLLENTPTDPLIEVPEERRNPLTLVFIIGGALLLIAMVLYLTLGSSPSDEHLTSTSQTAADSTAATPEVGPQAEQLTLPPAVPETIRVAPAIVPTPVAKSATSFASDSAVATPAPTATVPATKPSSAPVVKPAAAPTTTAPVTPTAKPDTAKTAQP